MSKKNKKEKKKDKKRKSADGSNKHEKVNGQSSLGNPHGVSSISSELSASDRLEEKMSKKDKKKDKKDKKKNSGNGSNKHEQVMVQAISEDQHVTSSIPPEGQLAIDKKTYEKELARLQEELIKLQEWIRFKNLKVVVIFEGRDAAGKGGAIKRITESLSPRVCRVVALPAPTEREKTQWYFQRYVAHLPAGGEMVLFDRSWYNRANVERVMGFCTNDEYNEFMRSVPEFERMLVRSGIILIKYWFSVSDKEQEIRFQSRIDDPTKRWKLSPMDLNSRARWVEYSKAKDEMFAHTDIKQAAIYRHLTSHGSDCFAFQR
ncbi:MAG: polyphosphate kinase 2 [Anaerolineae bacterium]|nr:polyphosphate kinase 2 [Anaerolineae bacterium]